jgi:phosphonate transport system permease protein
MKSRPINLLIIAALFGVVLISFSFLSLNLTDLFRGDALRQMRDYAGGFAQPDFSGAHLRACLRGALETLAMSAMGTLLAALLGLLLALPAAGRFGVVAKIGARFALNTLRAIPELVWAALMVLAAGLGPNAGALALGFHTAGVLGRLFAEAFENTPAAPADAVRLGGSGRIAAFFYGTLPGVWPQLVAYTLYRWENNIRMASILGFVGAGGLGQMLYVSLSLFQQAQAATIILVMLLIVLGVDAFSARVRMRWAG